MFYYSATVEEVHSDGSPKRVVVVGQHSTLEDAQTAIGGAHENLDVVAIESSIEASPGDSINRSATGPVKW